MPPKKQAKKATKKGKTTIINKFLLALETENKEVE